MTPDDYCEQKTAGAGSSFSYSFLFLDPDERRAMTVLYAFCREVDDVVDECSEPSIARIKLAWWRDEVARSYAGAAQHPVGKALHWAIEKYKLPSEHERFIRRPSRSCRTPIAIASAAATTRPQCIRPCCRPSKTAASTSSARACA